MRRTLLLETALGVTLALAGARAAPAQGRQLTLDVRPLAVTVGYARRVAPRRLVGVEVGLGAPQVELTLTPRGAGYHDFEEVLHLGVFTRVVPNDRVVTDVGLRASLADVTSCGTSDCLPGVFGGAYAAAYYGRRRLKVGALLEAGRAAEPGGRAVTVVNVSPLVARLTW